MKKIPSKLLLVLVEAGYLVTFVLGGVAYGVSEGLTSAWRWFDNCRQRLKGQPEIEYLDAEDRLRRAVNSANHAERFSISDAEYRRIMAARERAKQPEGDISQEAAR